MAGLAARGIVPGLAVVLVGTDPASQIYVRNKRRQTIEAGMHSVEHRLDAATSQAELLALVDRLNRDPAIHGILVQLPLPGHLDETAVINAIDPAKDVDGFHVLNVGRLATGQAAMVPCTPLGCLLLLRDRLGPLAGRNAVVIGRSNIVGKPMAQLLLRDSCTVTVAHSRSRDLPEICRGAEIWSRRWGGRCWSRATGSGRAPRCSMSGSTGCRSGTARPRSSGMSISPPPRRSRERLPRSRAGSGR